MKQVHVGVILVLMILLCTCLFGQTQQIVATNTNVAVPPLVNFSGVLTDLNGKPLTGVVGVTFSLYKDQQGGAPLWLETQNVKPNSVGRYTVMLGSTSSQGIPANLFASGEAHWLGVQVQGQAELSRVMLVSTPYALKAGDAETLGGKPASAFMAASGNALPGNNVGTNTITGGGTTDYVPLWLSKSKLGNSKLFQSAAGDLGIGTTTPAANLDVNGTTAIRNTLTLFPNGSAPTLSVNGTAFNVSNTGQVSFVSGQTFPGTGTVTSVGSGAGLTGGPITSSGTLSIATGGVSNAMLANPSLTVTAGTDLTGGGLVALGSSTTLNLDTTKVPQLNAANNFTGSQTVNGNLSATGVVTGSGYQIGSNLFDFGSYSAGNAFLGFAGSPNVTAPDNTAVGFQALTTETSTGGGNTAVGYKALYANTTGFFNTASGGSALAGNTTGDYNTAIGNGAFNNDITTGSGNTGLGYSAGVTVDFSNLTGSNDTFVGSNATPSTGSLSNATAIGANAEVTASNAMVLGAINGVNGATASTNVGIGTAAPAYPLQVQGDVTTATGVQTVTTNTSTSGDSFAVFAATSAAGVTTEMVADGLGNGPLETPSAYYGTYTNQPIGLITDNRARLVIAANGLVGIATTSPSNLLTLVRGGGAAIADGWSTYSSRRWKTNIETLHGALGKVEQLRGVSYDLKANGKHEVGVIAEEVGAVVPELVSYEENGKDARGVDYSRLTALLIEAVKQQQREIHALQSELRATRQTLQKVKAQVAAVQPILVAKK